MSEEKEIVRPVIKISGRPLLFSMCALGRRKCRCSIKGRTERVIQAPSVDENNSESSFEKATCFFKQ